MEVVQKFYNGNQNLMRVGSKFTWTKDMLEDLERCEKDIVYFAEKHFRIVHVDEGLIKLHLYDFQKEVLKDSVTNRNMVLNAARQVGKTTIATVIILHHCLFNKQRRVALLANKAETAQEILDRIKLAYEYLPAHLKGSILKWNERTVEFGNKSKIIAAASSSSNIRGKTCVSGDTIITVRNKNTRIIENISISELTNRINTTSPIYNENEHSNPERILHSLSDNQSHKQEDLCWISFN